jgi:uncharacterized protein YneR
MTSVLNVDTIADKAGTGTVTLTKQAAAKVFVKYSGSSAATEGVSLNISSVTDAATGRQSPNFSSAFTDANFTVQATCSDTLGGSAHAMIVNQDNAGAHSTTTTRIGVADGDNGNTYTDTESVSVTLHGDLA